MTEKLGPLDHIARPALPWRTLSDLTECGKPLADFEADRIITPDEVAARIRNVGRQRTSYTTCMTCLDTVQRWHSARVDPIEVLLREAQTVQGMTRYPAAFLDRQDPARRARLEAQAARRDRLVAELEAIAALVREHRVEFDAYLSGREETVSLADRRAARRVR